MILCLLSPALDSNHLEERKWWTHHWFLWYVDICLWPGHSSLGVSPSWHQAIQANTRLRHYISKYWPTKSQGPWGRWLTKQTKSIKLKSRNMKVNPDTVFLRFGILSKITRLPTIVISSRVPFLTSLNEPTVSIVYLFQSGFCYDHSA